MNKPLSVTSRLIILVIIAVVFSATVIGLSIRHRTDRSAETIFDQGDKNIERSFTVQPDGILIVDADAGNISITGTDQNEVSIRVITRGNSKKLQNYDVSFNQEGNTVTVKGEMKRKHFRFFSDGWVDVQFEIGVPSKFNCNVSTSGGNIEIQKVSGRLEGETSGGNLEITDVSGSLEMSTSGGNVDLRRVTGTTNVETSGGNMQADDISGPLKLRTSGGNIDIRNADGKLHASTSGGHIRASVKQNQGIDLSTSGGDISIEIPRSTAANIHAETSDGSISCDLEYSGKIRDGRMDARINGGGEEIRLETSGGDIVISPND
jgi:DUF4097 and DUF4098 domain-containing protein YvlB